MGGKSVFVAHNKDWEFIGLTLYQKAKELKIPLEVSVCKEYPLKQIPRSYDAYVLHPSDINERDLANLREEYPRKKVFAVGGFGKFGFADPLTKERMKHLYDNMYTTGIDEETAENIIQQLTRD